MKGSKKLQKSRPRPGLGIPAGKPVDGPDDDQAHGVVPEQVYPCKCGHWFRTPEERVAHIVVD